MLYMIFLALILAIMGFLFAPVSLTFDLTQKYLKVEWMSLSITKRLEKKKGRGPKEKPEKEGKWNIKTIGLLLVKDRELVFDLFQKGYRSAKDMLRSVSIREIEGTLSTPDPMCNGVLCGIFSNIHLKNVRVSVNFQDINYVRGRLQFYPYKVLKVAGSLTVRLPYRRILRAVLSNKKQ